MSRFLAMLLAVCLTGVAGADEFLLDEPHVRGQLVILWKRPAQPPSPVPALGRSMVRRAPTGFDQSVDRLLHQLGLRPVATLRKGRVWLVGSAPPLADPDLATRARALRASNLVDAVAANSLVYFEDSGAPNDPEFATQWALQPARIDAPGAWAVTKGSKQVVVAVVDTGVDLDHPDLADNLWINPCEDVNGNGKIDLPEKDGGDTACSGEQGNDLPDDFHGWNFVSMNADVSDLVPHGTHVAGIVGAVTGNAIGVAGIAQASLAVVKVGNAFLTDVTRVAAGIDYAVDLGADVVNASFTTVNHYLLDSAVKNAGTQGVLVVAAAGRGQYAGDDLAIYPTYPAAYPYENVIAVTSTTEADGLDVYANYGASVVEIGAPGDSIVSTLPGGYFARTGTSMAAPHVSGVVALIRAVRPEASVQEIRKCLGQGDALPSLAGKTEWGVRLNARRALEACAPTTPIGRPGCPSLIP
jgi:subtilisin family serine protease